MFKIRKNLSNPFLAKWSVMLLWLSFVNRTEDKLKGNRREVKEELKRWVLPFNITEKQKEKMSLLKASYRAFTWTETIMIQHLSKV